MNSAIATKTDSTRPDASTMNIPPRFWIPMGPVSRRSSSKQLLPLHHFSFSMCRRPSSKMLRIAMVILSLYGEPGSNIRPVLLWKKRQLDSVIIRFINMLWHTVWLVAKKTSYAAASSKKQSLILILQKERHNLQRELEFFYYLVLKCIHWSFEGLTEGSADAIAFAVDEPSHLCQITVPPSNVINSGGLHNEGIVWLQHPLNPILYRLHQWCAWLAAHEGPHLLKGRNLRFL